jgi:hypothetical protein
MDPAGVVQVVRRIAVCGHMAESRSRRGRSSQGIFAARAPGLALMALIDGRMWCTSGASP